MVKLIFGLTYSRGRLMFYVKGQIVSILRLCGLCVLHCHYLPLPSYSESIHRKYIIQCAWICSNKTLLTKPSLGRARFGPQARVCQPLAYRINLAFRSLPASFNLASHLLSIVGSQTDPCTQRAKRHQKSGRALQIGR